MLLIVLLVGRLAYIYFFTFERSPSFRFSNPCRAVQSPPPKASPFSGVNTAGPEAAKNRPCNRRIPIFQFLFFNFLGGWGPLLKQLLHLLKSLSFLLKKKKIPSKWLPVKRRRLCNPSPLLARLYCGRRLTPLCGAWHAEPVLMEQAAPLIDPFSIVFGIRCVPVYSVRSGRLWRNWGQGCRGGLVLWGLMGSLIPRLLLRECPPGKAIAPCKCLLGLRHTPRGSVHPHRSLMGTRMCPGPVDLLLSTSVTAM